MPRARKLTPDQAKAVKERNLLYMRFRLEAAKHSVTQLAREFGVNKNTIERYLGMRF